MDREGREIAQKARKAYVAFALFRVFRVPDSLHPFESLVRKLLTADGQGPQVEAWERELNALVYKVYGLMVKEVAIVEGSTADEGNARRR